MIIDDTRFSEKKTLFGSLLSPFFRPRFFKSCGQGGGDREEGNMEYYRVKLLVFHFSFFIL